MFYKKKGKPEVGEVVICTVKRILLHSVFVSIDDYENLEGMVHISEIAPGRIRNLRDYVTEGKRIICKVLNINIQGNIDLSLRRVGNGVMASKLNEYKQEEKAEKLLELIAKENKLDLKGIYEEVGFKAVDVYGGLYNFFQRIITEGKQTIDALKVKKEIADSLFKTIKEKIKPIEVEVTGILTLKSYSPNGVEDIKKALTDLEQKGIKVSYLGAPKYKLAIKSDTYKKAEAVLKSGLDALEVHCKKYPCEKEFTKND